MKRTKQIVILNPAAGGGRCKKSAPQVLSKLKSAGFELDVVETRSGGDAAVLAESYYRQGHRNFIAVGGDGTCFEVVNGVMPMVEKGGEPIALGMIPLGTGNSFLKDFTQDGATHTVAAMEKGNTRHCDVVKLVHADGQKYFINIFSVGFVADVADITNRRFKRFGETGYVLGVLAELLRLHPREWTIRNGKGENFSTKRYTFICASNSRYTGGKMLMAPDADTADGKMDIICVGPVRRFNLLRSFPRIFDGTHVDHPAFESFKVEEMEFHGDEKVNVMLDGESFRLVPKRLEVLKSAMEVRV